MRIFFGTVLLLSLLSLATCQKNQNQEQAKSETAKSAEPQANTSPPVSVSLISHSTEEHGKLTGIYFQMQPSWHIYGPHPGDSGLPTKVTWTAPQNWTVSKATFPKAEQFKAPGDIVTYGYEKETLIYSKLLPTDKTQDNVVDQGPRKLACLQCRALRARRTKH
ncbi:MAG: hypothetical protein IPJ88_05700 [Myxococcales bacterium]|nr:MAG: hypothetical protein IPJ88_05700 [Myxococcales bacterium]